MTTQNSHAAKGTLSPILPMEDSRRAPQIGEGIGPYDYSITEQSERTLSKCQLKYCGKDIYWNPRFNEIQISNAQHLFCSDDKELFFSVEEYQIITTLLTGKNIGSDVGFTRHGIQLLIVLKQQGVLVEAPQVDEVFTPSFTSAEIFKVGNSFQFRFLSDNRVVVQCLKSRFSSGDFASQATIVVVDDFLDPRLPDIHSHQIAISTPWIPLQISGSSMMLGPCFGKSVSSEDFMAFQKTLEGNRPILKWCRAKYDISPVAPLLMLSKVNHFFIEQLPHLIQLVQEPVEFGHFYTIGAESKEIVRHAANLQKCSGSQTMAAEGNGEIRSFEGGYRSCKPEDTLNVIRKEISPIAGAVYSLQCISPENAALKVYCSSFPRVPLNKEVVCIQDFVQYALGKGISAGQSMTSALAEAIERRNSSYDGTENVIFSPMSNLKEGVLSPCSLRAFSERQFEEFKTSNSNPNAAERYDASISLHWTFAFSLVSGQQLLVPFTYCYSNTPFQDERYIRFNSNGNAAGNTLDEAIIQGFLELVERDAVAVWWYNRLQRPCINIADVSLEIVSLFEIATKEEWDHWVLDLTTDFEIPVFAAIGKNRRTGRYRFGFGAHFEVHIAIERAISELYQLIIVGNQISPTRFDNLGDAFWLEPSGVLDIAQENPETTRFKSTQDCLNHCIELVSILGMDIIYIDTSRSLSRLRTVKVIVPGLCFIWPELGNPRLYTLPAKIGWSNVLQTETELNPVPLFV